MVYPIETNNLYAQWRCPDACASGLHDHACGPSEYLLQVIWLHQRIRRHQLQTLRHGKLTILHPGFWNQEAGPDFRNAIIQLEGAGPVSGDVEIDLTPAGWTNHRHHHNPSFRNVVLHVVWEGSSQSHLPTLVLRGVLDASLEDLAAWTTTEASQSLPPHVKGQCTAQLCGFNPSTLQALLRQAALVRLEGKARHLQARARQAGWDQALWESLFRGLGYKHNVWPMQRLAELKDQLPLPQATVVASQAILLGTATLLPQQLHRLPFQTAGYIRELWDCWWREQATLQPLLLPPKVWRFHGLRPANHPARRLALAAHWLQQKDLVNQIEQWGVSPGPDTITQKIQALLQILQPQEDVFWNWHWTFRSPRLSQARPLIGRARATDLVVNAILPWLWVRAVEGKNRDLQGRLRELYLSWPGGEDNTLLRQARQRLLGTRRCKNLRSASAQQGLLQITSDFCACSNALCEGCPFPGHLQTWSAESEPHALD